MEYITKEGLINALKESGINKGDTIIVHSDISSFGVVENFTKKKQLETFYNAFMEVLGEEGTLCVPSFFFEYGSNGIPFDISGSQISSSLGVFSKYITSLPNRKRSPMPITSVSAIGKHAEYICEAKNRHGYGIDSAWDRMYKLNTKIISLGFLGGLTFTNYIEHKIGIPYMYTKIFRTPVLDNGKVIFDYTFNSVRFLEFNVDRYLREERFEKAQCIEKGVTKAVNYLHAPICVTYMHDRYNYIKELYYNDPDYFLKHEPDYIKGKVPDDGINLTQI